MAKVVEKFLTGLNTASDGIGCVAVRMTDTSTAPGLGSLTTNPDAVEIVLHRATGNPMHMKWTGIMIGKGPAGSRVFFAALNAPTNPGTGTAGFTISIGGDPPTATELPTLYAMSITEEFRFDSQKN